MVLCVTHASAQLCVVSSRFPHAHTLPTGQVQAKNYYELDVIFATAGYQQPKQLILTPQCSRRAILCVSCVFLVLFYVFCHLGEILKSGLGITF